MPAHPGREFERGRPERQRIAVAVIPDATGQRVLLARRPDHAAHGGLWEFPGGKQEAGEDMFAALVREVREELDLVVDSAHPLLRIPHDYVGTRVELHVWVVDAWHGQPRGMEGQVLEWVPVPELAGRAFPDANHDIVAALQLPEVVAITPDLAHYDAGFLAAAGEVLGAGVKVLQFRSRRADAVARATALQRLARICRDSGCALMVNGTVEEVHACGARGIQLPAAALMAAGQRPLPRPFLVGASCHGEHELRHAEQLGVDFVLLGSVAATATHPGVPALGWDRFRHLLRHGRRVPVYGLGGMTPADLPAARRAGARGVAMISALWGSVARAGEPVQ